MTKMAAIMGEEVVETGDFVVNEKDKIVNFTSEALKRLRNSLILKTLLIQRIWKSSIISFLLLGLIT